MTYYMRCKKWAARMVQSGLPARQFQTTFRGTTWEASVQPWWSDNVIVAHGRTREKACKRLWETLVELGVAEEGD